VTTAAPKACATTGLKTVKVAALGIYTDGILTLAKDKCYFADNGIAVEITTVPNPPASVAALTGGQVDVAYAPSIPLVRATANGAPVKALAAADGYTDDAIKAYGTKLDDTGVFVPNDSPLKTAKDLEGKKVAVPARGAQLEVTTADAVKKAGGDPSKLNFVALDLPNMIDAAKSGQIDAAALVAPFSNQALAGGMRLLDANGVTFFGAGAVGLWLTTDPLMGSKGADLKAFRTAIYKANADANADPDGFWAFDAKATDVPLDVISKAGIKYVFPTKVDLADLTKVADKLVGLGFLDKAPDLSASIIP
jgi:NitT/TauT family transport system substrate-binding protein